MVIFQTSNIILWKKYLLCEICLRLFCVVVHLSCQLGCICSHLGDTPLGMCVTVFPEMTHIQWGWQCPTLRYQPDWTKMENGENELSTRIYLSVFWLQTKCDHCLLLLLSACPSWLWWTVSSNSETKKPSLPLFHPPFFPPTLPPFLGAAARYFVTSVRIVSNIFCEIKKLKLYAEWLL